MRTTLTVIFLAILLAIVGYQIHKGIHSKQLGKKTIQRREPVVEIAMSQKMTISHHLELTGAAEPYRRVVMATPAEGPVLKIDVREGDSVSQRQVLLEIGRKEGVDALIVSIKDEYEKAKSSYERAKHLSETNAISSEEFESRRNEFEKVKAALVQAEETANDHTVKAPWDGIVSHVLVKEGEYVTPRYGLMELYDPTSMVIRSTVSEKNVAQIKPDMTLEVRLDAYPDQVFAGRISRIYPYLDTVLRTQTIEILLDESVSLLPGMFARLKLPLRTIPDALVVPSEAVVLTPEGWQVKLLQDNKSVPRPVMTGIEDGSWTEIVDGLEGGETVITKGNDVKDGATVKVREPKSRAVTEQPKGGTQ